MSTRGAVCYKGLATRDILDSFLGMELIDWVWFKVFLEMEHLQSRATLEQLSMKLYKSQNTFRVFYSPPDKSTWGYIRVCWHDQSWKGQTQVVGWTRGAAQISLRARGETDIIRGDSIWSHMIQILKTANEKQKSRSGSPEIMDWDNASSFHQATVDPDYLVWPAGPHKWYINNDKLRIPDYLFLNKYHYLLCSSILI